MCNVNETGMMVNLGLIKGGDGRLVKRKQEKNADDYLDSIQILRISNAAGSSGPLIFHLARERHLNLFKILRLILEHPVDLKL